MGKMLNTNKNYYRDVEGKSISREEWGNLINQKFYSKIGRDYVRDFLISTVWLGIPHCEGDDFDFYYETMIFKNKVGSDLFCKRYKTKKEAEEGHKKIVDILEEEKDLKLNSRGNFSSKLTKKLWAIFD